MKKSLTHLFNVTLVAAASVRVFTEKPTRVNDDLRAFGDEVVHTSQIAYASSDGIHLVTGAATFSLEVASINTKGDLMLLTLVDGTKATFNTKAHGLEINISSLSEDSAEDEDEGEEAGEEDEVDEDEDEDEIPVKKPARGAKAAPAKKRGKAAAADDEDEEDFNW